MLLKDKIAIVTGAARGQGASHARHLAGEGAKVIVTDILDDLGKAVAEEIRESGGEAEYVRLDVRNSDEWSAVVGDVVKRYGTVDVLVNNAGVCEFAPPAECSDEEWAYVNDTNAGGVFKGCRAVIPVMQQHGGGTIVNTASVQAVKGTADYTAYQASKAAVLGITRSVALTYSKENIRANAVAPSVVDTPMFHRELEHFAQNEWFDFDAWLEMQPISRASQPEEVSKMVVFLASDLSSYSTGGVFPVDGGLLA
ncbi:SDR family NAD(P)-dependent oxidoreductase [Nocardioides sp. CER19]|uniref:SDR family NAD(P)-dependent oxidoreductase n=1 Tax=Nocardioides sp. CER19 TaxID=3038538 RepID=UPI00244CF571|nr:SDR family NAD(P)-dependent oxidoreductase [Nocardioides sp. CER19]MDH2416116.1 SDR family NAD(P)-dependent oxidoreductase [Nocardioides sp. CER19]